MTSIKYCRKAIYRFSVGVVLIAGAAFPLPSQAQEVIQLGPDTLGLDDTTQFRPVTQSLLSQNLTPDLPIVRVLDSLINIKFFQDYYLQPDNQMSNIYQFPVDQIPHYPDSVVAKRIAELNRNTPFDLTYNQHVKDFIDLYAVRKRALTSRALGLAAVYFPLFEEMLDKYNMPHELKYLAVVESALNPTAVSRAGARGLWQFMYNTGKMYGLRSNSLVDDRSDPYKATDAACRHLRDLFEIYNDWPLALAAYNSGAGNVNKAIRRAGGVKNYWAVWPYLPRETRGYVPAFIAVTYVMNYAPEHNLYPLHPGILYEKIDTVMVKDVLAFEQISEFLTIPPDLIRFLNPAYKESIIPATKEKPYVLRLPRDKTGSFINNETALYQYKTQKGIEREKLLASIKATKERTSHTVRKGETLAKIAKIYSCSSQDIKKWNGLRKNTLRRGQRLIIYPGGAELASATQKDSKAVPANQLLPGNNEPLAQVATSDTSVKTLVAHQTDSMPKNQPSTLTHKVAKGETLSYIAKKYRTDVATIKKNNNLKTTNVRIGQKLEISLDDNNQKSSPEPHQKYEYYTVKKGDTLFKIAETIAKISLEELKKINSITSENSLKIGQKLIIGIIN